LFGRGVGGKHFFHLISRTFSVVDKRIFPKKRSDGLYHFQGDANEKDKKKKSTKMVELMLEPAATHGYSLAEMEKYVEKEVRALS
jgi:hypothetical protein